MTWNSTDFGSSTGRKPQVQGYPFQKKPTKLQAPAIEELTPQVFKDSGKVGCMYCVFVFLVADDKRIGVGQFAGLGE